MTGKYLDILLNHFRNAFVPADWLKKNNHHSLGQDLDSLSSFPYGKLYSMWKIEGTPASIQVLLKFCWASVKNKMFTTSSRTSREVVLCVLLHSRNDNPSTSFLIAGSSFSTCLKSALLHTSISANVNSQESHLPVSCHNHQTTHEGFLPVRGVLIWPWKHSPVATGSSLDEVTLVTKSQRNIHNEENYTVSLWLNLVGRSRIYWPYTQQLGKKHFLCCCKWSDHDTGRAGEKTSDKILLKHL